MSSPRNSRCHPPLIPASRQIRLLSFKEHAGAILACDLTVHNLCDCPRFIALSYTWGAPDQNQNEIRVNGVPITIRDNLRSALESIRRHISIAKRKASLGQADAPRILSQPEDADLSDSFDQSYFDQSPAQWVYFWIDAVCINQNNLSERNHQVSMMREIYSTASFVLAWLGVSCEKSLRFIVDTPADTLASQVDTTWSNPPVEMAPLIYADYWSRSWVLQEFVLASRIIIGAGSKFLHWSEMQSLFPPASDESRLLYGIYDPMNLVVQERYERGKRQKEGFYKSLGGLLDRFTNLECSDQRDKIFSLLGLFSESPINGEQMLRADYSLTPKQLYLEVLSKASLYLENRDDLERLGIYVSSELMVDPEGEEELGSRRGSRRDSSVDW